MKQDHKRLNLYEALEDIKRFQDIMTDTWSKYYDYWFIKMLGTDTIPFTLMTTEAKLLRLRDEKEKIETNYFRIEEIDKQSHQMKVTLLKAYDLEGSEANSLKNVVKLEKTKATATVYLHRISAVQLVSTQLFACEYFVESKW